MQSKAELNSVNFKYHSIYVSFSQFMTMLVRRFWSSESDSITIDKHIVFLPKFEVLCYHRHGTFCERGKWLHFCYLSYNFFSDNDKIILIKSLN